jgi:hypothetical protein
MSITDEILPQSVVEEDGILPTAVRSRFPMLVTGCQ